MDWPTVVLGVLNAVIINFSGRPLVWGPDLKQRPQAITIPEPTKASPFEAYAITVAAPAPSSTPEPRLGAPLFPGFFSLTTLFWILLFVFLAACGVVSLAERAAVARAPPPAETVRCPEPAEDGVQEVLPFFEPAVGESAASPDFMEILVLLLFACMAKDGGWDPEKLLERCQDFLMAFGRRYGFDSTTTHDPSADGGSMNQKPHKSPARPSSSSRRKFGDMVTLAGINTKPVILTPGLFLHVLYSMRRDFSVLRTRRSTIPSAAPGTQHQGVRPSWQLLPAPESPPPAIVYANAASQTHCVSPAATPVCSECEMRAQLGDDGVAPTYETAESQTDEIPPAAPPSCSDCEKRAQLEDRGDAPAYADLTVQTDDLPPSIDLRAFLEIADAMYDAFRMLDNAGDNSFDHKGRLKDVVWRTDGGTVDTHMANLEAALRPHLEALPPAARTCLETVSERAMLYRKYEILQRDKFHRGPGLLTWYKEWMKAICERNFEWKTAEIEEAQEVMRQAGNLMDVQGLIEDCETRQKAPEESAETKKEVVVKLPGREGIVVGINQAVAVPRAAPAVPQAAPEVAPAAPQARADAPRGPRAMRTGGGIGASRWAT